MCEKNTKQKHTKILNLLSAHPRTDRGVISSPKPTKKRTSYPTLNNRSHQTENKLLKTKSRQSPKSSNKRVKIKHRSPRCALWCSCRSLNHQLVTQGAKNNSPRYQHRSSKQSPCSANHPYQQSTYHQLLRRPAAGAKPKFSPHP